MIFSARSTLPAWAASHACSANLRPRRPSFTFCFLGFIRSSSARNGDSRHNSGEDRAARSYISGWIGERAPRPSAVARIAPQGVGDALTEEDRMDHSHEGIIGEAALWTRRFRPGRPTRILART